MVMVMQERVAIAVTPLARHPPVPENRLAMAMVHAQALRLTGATVKKVGAVLIVL